MRYAVLSGLSQTGVGFFVVFCSATILLMSALAVIGEPLKLDSSPKGNLDLEFAAIGESAPRSIRC